MKYMVITAKHHDGYCLWPSEYTDYDITATPFKRDPLKELAEACREQDIDFGIYCSVCDWWHPDYPRGSPKGQTAKPNPDMDRYVDYMRHQTAELIKNYGPLLTLWFDRKWEKPWTQEMSNKLYDELKRIQPSQW